jgi:GNAT superfamily N-acetyltransferase
MQQRDATRDDAEAVADLHADSWRRHYRGAYDNDYLDGDVFAERRALWSERLARIDPTVARTILIEDDGRLLGFSHVMFDDNPTWGALVDNLHVTFDHKRGGLGTALLRASALAVVERSRPTGLYLWALEMNTPARAFYRARGGEEVEFEMSDLEGGGQAMAVRYAWRDLAVLLSPGATRPA